ncbi:5-dehydro-4-deoxy-D-glucuronate isomerase [Mycoplasmopsis fermentans]|uniref:4-deoxy-L-threo-5-hexosulose-uronate ketol-isomerase n=1 Tax=Mycoplasmopsis fermentans (strain M64) TaxID=943945 RepID=A0AB32XC39_MYCFM|nr:5-dehydro-4-deoxy-D-glucuronate isomerase [Mycoplasmopsis fermentans]ADV34602.1 4-deoxy-L-threo-5-hexosulose-uronate ketol-isomerase [Mycoplasmopsis fermentans M64]
MRFKTTYAVSANETSRMTTEELRSNFLIEDLFESGKLNVQYLHYDRIIVGGATPTSKGLNLDEVAKEIAAPYFCERREIGIINIGNTGYIEFDNGIEKLENKDGLYLPVGNKKIIFKSADSKKPAKFYFFSTQGLKPLPVRKVNIKDAIPNKLGTPAESNVRTIYQYFHPKVCQTNSLLMGITILEPNNMWNTMPCHTHERRTECYLYIDVAEGQRVIHLMGKPQETKHLVVKNEGFVISAPWSIHSGVGTSNYAFIWAMGGENLDYTDMQGVKTIDLK